MRHSIYEVGSDFDVLQVLSLLHRVIEAAHLIEVRENKKEQDKTKGRTTKRERKKSVTKK